MVITSLVFFPFLSCPTFSVLTFCVGPAPLESGRPSAMTHTTFGIKRTDADLQPCKNAGIRSDGGLRVSVACKQRICKRAHIRERQGDYKQFKEHVTFDVQHPQNKNLKCTHP